MWLCSVFAAVAGASAAQTISVRRWVLTVSPQCRASAARTAFRRSPLTGRGSWSTTTSIGPSSRTAIERFLFLFPVPVVPHLCTNRGPSPFGDGLNWSEPQEERSEPVRAAGRGRRVAGPVPGPVGTAAGRLAHRGGQRETRTEGHMMTSNGTGIRILGTLRSADGKGVVRMQDRFDTDIDDLWSALTE